jgi:excisionase family DNA binding protein
MAQTGLLTFAEAARRLSVDKDTMSEMVKRGDLPSVPFGRTRRVRACDVEWFATGEGKKPGMQSEVAAPEPFSVAVGDDGLPMLGEGWPAATVAWFAVLRPLVGSEPGSVLALVEAARLHAEAWQTGNPAVFKELRERTTIVVQAAPATWGFIDDL